MIVFVDVDGVCADLGTEWLARYNHDYDDNLTIEQITGWDMVPHVRQECGERIYDYLRDPRIYDNVKPLPDAQMGVRVLRELGHDVIFATSTPPEVAGRKYYWLVENGFIPAPSLHPKDYIELSDKRFLRGDILIDDGPHNVQSFVGCGILFDRPHNHYFTEWPMRARDWSDIIHNFDYDSVPAGSHITEIKRPAQSRAFREIVDSMYQVHLSKNADYSPANILGTGEVGLMTRVWDKVARLMNLMGFKVEIASFNYTQPSVPKCEAIDDTILDLANYAVIWQIYRQGKWGK